MSITQVAPCGQLPRVARNPQEATEGLDSNVIPIGEVRVGTSEENSEAILHLTTTDNIPIAVGMPAGSLARSRNNRSVCLRACKAPLAPRGASTNRLDDSRANFRRSGTAPAHRGLRARRGKGCAGLRAPRRSAD